MYVLESNIPIPNLGRPPKYPLADMLVGQSFFVPLGDRKTVSVLASRMGKTTGRTFTVRRVDGGIRVWRVK